jgi:hypothetical protein
MGYAVWDGTPFRQTPPQKEPQAAYHSRPRFKLDFFWLGGTGVGDGGFAAQVYRNDLEFQA